MYEVDCPRCFHAFPVGAEDRRTDCPRCRLAMDLVPEVPPGADPAAPALMEFEVVDDAAGFKEAPCPACAGPLLLAPEDAVGLCPHCDARLEFHTGEPVHVPVHVPPSQHGDRPYAPLVVCREVPAGAAAGAVERPDPGEPSPSGSSSSSPTSSSALKRARASRRSGSAAKKKSGPRRRAAGRQASGVAGCSLVVDVLPFPESAFEPVSNCAVGDDAFDFASDFTPGPEPFRPSAAPAARFDAWPPVLPGVSRPDWLPVYPPAEAPFFVMAADEFDLELGADDEGVPAEADSAGSDSASTPTPDEGAQAPSETPAKALRSRKTKKEPRVVERKVDPEMPDGIPLARFGRRLREPERAPVEECPECSHPFRIHPRDREAQCPHCLAYLAFDRDADDEAGPAAVRRVEQAADDDVAQRPRGRVDVLAMEETLRAASRPGAVDPDPEPAAPVVEEEVLVASEDGPVVVDEWEADLDLEEEMEAARPRADSASVPVAAEESVAEEPLMEFEELEDLGEGLAVGSAPEPPEESPEPAAPEPPAAPPTPKEGPPAPPIAEPVTDPAELEALPAFEPLDEPADEADQGVDDGSENRPKQGVFGRLRRSRRD